MPAASLTGVPAGSGVFVDTNIFVYALLGQSAECQQVLRRCASQEIYGVTSVHVVSEATHQLMLAEACGLGHITRRNDWKGLARKPATVMQLSQYWCQVLTILQMNLLILNPGVQQLHTAHAVRKRHGLMTSDSLIVAAMDDSALSVLLSGDAGFDRIPNVTRYFPSDVQPST